MRPKAAAHTGYGITVACLIVAAFFPVARADDPVFIEAEAFQHKGGWVVDQQYMDRMGSPVLLAHGLGEPVSDSITEIVLPRLGLYRVFVRTRNWVAPWTPQHAPGRFQLSVNGKKLETVFGTEGAAWHWQDGGSVDTKDVKVKLGLHDLTGFDGRVDAIILTTDPNYKPPEDIREIEKIRRKTLRLPASPLDAPEAREGPFDLVVVGGGVAGICSAIAAARLDCKVAFIQDRPHLGGNNSSEVRVHLQGRMGYPPYPNLGNLVHELDPQQDGNAQAGDAYKDWKKLEAVRAEKNITLYLNTRVIAAETEKSADGSIRIKSVIGKNIETSIETKFAGKLFADCTGDANLGFLAGAQWRTGRESKAETGEDLAPEKPDSMTMGASVQWSSAPALDARGNPVRTTFPALPWAYQFTHESATPAVRGDWDWETGIGLDQVADAERIRDNGLRAVYGHWAYMKNQSEPEWRRKAETRKLDWVAFVAGKRESRRLLGDVVLKEQDLVNRTDWPDACVVTTWTIDLHYPEARNSKFFPGNEFRTVAKYKRIQPCAIPYRCLYSNNVSNLFMAGRCISVTHVALGTVRVMRTAGMMGEVVGMAASLASKNGTTPRGVYERHLGELQQLMKRGVAPKPEKYWHSAQPTDTATPPRKPTPPVWLEHAGKNLALGARVAVSSEFRGAVYSPSNIIDGRIEPRNDSERWVSEKGDHLTTTPHWIELRLESPVEVNAYRLVSGQKDGTAPIRACRLQRLENTSWIDVAGAELGANEEPDVGKRFAPVKSSAYRLLITETPGGLARVWELELYKVEE